MCSERVGSSCSTYNTRRVTLVTNTVKSHECPYSYSKTGQSERLYIKPQQNTWGSCFSIFSFLCSDLSDNEQNTRIQIFYDIKAWT
jgi:hypothetical protein